MNNKEIINTGMTNISYREGNIFVQEKIYKKFNHKIDYQILEKLDFVPKLLSNEKEMCKWEFINGSEPILNDENICKIAKLIKKTHDSKLHFPASNHAARVKEYRKILSQKNINIPVLNDFYRNVNTTLSKMDKSIPLHNDLWVRNIIVDNNDKIFFCDWEYASMGDIHFDLAYFIESADLNKDQEKLFLDSYGWHNELHLLRHKILVNYLIVLWVHCQEKIHFSTKEYENRIYKYGEQLKKYQ
ncbi:phosphotransferase [Mycoplasma tauri]|uniref:phosphotransferase n=1 Tax=Mycoplasma tauri TaxID=547987 RepID=UPI001967C8CA|nr:phosphotransferase [Mycoplasma tauri]MBZ4203441.1 phosphotransferase [Mycoplasma tauri]MBZ4212914.1 phosphotransferase [Mycoplasma tauri]MBZ4226894.1 phosphotransferase [Mycoplasma tauri]QSB07670.1 phosphotransferase [Mycoplasma tauri]